MWYIFIDGKRSTFCYQDRLDAEQSAKIMRRNGVNAWVYSG